MKTTSLLFLCLISMSAFGHSVLDSMYDDSTNIVTLRNPASNVPTFCLADPNNKIFAKGCYSTLEKCEKRLSFWQDLPAQKPSQCIKL